MSWDELIAYNRRWVEAHKDNTFQHEAARRMAVLLDAMEALLADDVIERVADLLYEEDYAAPLRTHDDWCDRDGCTLVEGYRRTAREAMAVALGIEVIDDD